MEVEEGRAGAEAREKVGRKTRKHEETRGWRRDGLSAAGRGAIWHGACRDKGQRTKIPRGQRIAYHHQPTTQEIIDLILEKTHQHSPDPGVNP